LRQAGKSNKEARVRREAERKRLNPNPLTPAEVRASRIKIAAVETVKTPTTKTNITKEEEGCLEIFTVPST